MTELPLPVYSIDRTCDEFGEDRFFVANRRGEWISEPFPTYELAHDELLALLADYIDLGNERTS